MRTIRIFAFTIALISGTITWGQNQLHISQFNLYQPFTNPAAIADINTMNAALLHKSQWLGVEGAPTFQQFGFNIPVNKELKSFVGANVKHDRIGVNSSINVGLDYAYKVKLNQTSSLAFGLAGGVNIIQSKLDEVPLNNEADPVFNANTGTFATPNFQFGMFYRNQKFYAGFATPNILKNRIVFENAFESQTSFDITDVHFYLSSGYRFELNENTDLQVDGLFKHSTGAPMQMDFNVMARFKKKFGIGCPQLSA